MAYEYEIKTEINGQTVTYTIKAKSLVELLKKLTLIIPNTQYRMILRNDLTK